MKANRDSLIVGMAFSRVASRQERNVGRKWVVLDLESKIISINALAAWRASVRRAGLKLVATNGCFDLLHAGHVIYLEAARKLGDALLIGLNGDASVRALKGFGRPINSELDRARVLAALASVDAVCIFPEVTATRFLSLAEPECYVKGGDYRLETLNRDEREAVEKSGGQIVLLPLVAGRSTSALLAKMREETKPPIEN